MIATILDYRRITKDWDNYDGDVAAALDKSQKLVEELTERYFELRDTDGEILHRTETLKMHPNGLVYPHAAPVYSVYDNDNATVLGNGVHGAYGGPAYPNGWYGYYYPYGAVTIEYSGGYEATDMPEEIVRLVAHLAEDGLEVSSTSSGMDIPAGVKTAHVGDVSLTLDPEISAADSANVLSTSAAQNVIRRWKRREV